MRMRVESPSVHKSSLCDRVEVLKYAALIVISIIPALFYLLVSMILDFMSLILYALALLFPSMSLTNKITDGHEQFFNYLSKDQ